MRIVVSGGAGFIGGNLCRDLVSRGHEVTAFDDLSSGLDANLVGSGAALIVGSILDTELLQDAVSEAAAVVHLAARPSVPRSLADPMASHLVNATGTMEVLEAVRRVGRAQLIVASSSSVYGSNPQLPKSEDLMPRPMSPYAASKLATESYALAYGASFGLDVLAFRFFNVFGPLQQAGHAYAAVIPALLDAALHKRPLPVHGDGLQTRDFTYVSSLTSVIMSAVERRITSDLPVNLAFGSRVSILEVVSLLEDLFDTKLPIAFEPSRVGDVRDSQADQTRLRNLFPDIEPVEFKIGLHATLDWFRQTIG